MKTTDRQMIGVLRSLYRDSSPSDTEGAEFSRQAVETLWTKGAPSGLSGAMILPAERLSLWFKVKKAPTGWAGGPYLIRPILELKSSKPRGESPFGMSPLRPMMLSLDGGWENLGLLVAEKRADFDEPFGGSLDTLVSSLKADPSCLTKSPSFGPRIEDALTEDGDALSEVAIKGQALLGVNALLEQLTEFVGVQIPLPQIGSDRFDRMKEEEGDDLDRAVPRMMSEIIKSSKTFFRASLNLDPDLIEGLMKEVLSAFMNLPEMTDLVRSLFLENWKRERTEVSRVKAENKVALQLGSLLKIADDSPPDEEELVLHGALREIEKTFGSFGGASFDVVNRAPRKPDGSPVWEDRLMIPFVLEGASVCWVGEPTYRSPSRFDKPVGEAGLSTSIIFSVHPSATAFKTKPSSSEETAPSDTTSSSEETAPSDKTSSSEETAPSEPPPRPSFPSMENWFDLFKV